MAENFQLNQHLSDFFLLEKELSGKVNQSIFFDFKKHDGHIVFSSLIHGSEIGPLPAFLRVIQKLRTGALSFGGKVSFVLGNVEAAQKGVRFIEADLNRSFGRNVRHMQTLERKRAEEMMDLLDTSHVFIDFHQTIKPCAQPFYIFEMDPQSYLWARALGGTNVFLTRKKGAGFSSAGMCSDEYVRSKNKVGVTIELGEKGFSADAEQKTLLIIERALSYMDKVWQQRRPIKKIAHKNKDFDFFQIKYREPFYHPKILLHEGLYNFYEVKKGAELGLDEHKHPILAPDNGFILFPKYPERNSAGEADLPLPGEIFILAQKICEHPLNWKKHEVCDA